jgi:CheY-like chemotaxis protein
LGGKPARKNVNNYLLPTPGIFPQITVLRLEQEPIENSVNPEIRILFVEDAPAEAALVVQALEKGGLTFQMQRVETREDFLQALSSQRPDVILSDHGLPAFDGFAALTIAHKECPQVPFLFVTNALQRDMEIEKLVPGVTDYILKSRLHLLAPTIRCVLHLPDKPETGGVKQEELDLIREKLMALMEEYEKAGGYLPICSSCKKIRDRQDAWLQPETFFRKYTGLKFTHGICPDCVDKFF